MTARVGIAEAARILGGHDTVTALCHVQPDADAIGSAAGLTLALKAAGAVVHTSFDPGVVPADFAAIPGADLFVPLAEVPAHDGLVVVLDCASPDRVGRADHLLDAAGEVLVVDHHRSNPGFGDHLLLDASAASTATLVVEVLDAAGWEVGADIATALYAGLVTDTGSFRWGGPDSHATALRLARAGADTEMCTHEFLDAHHFDYLRFLGDMLGRVRLEPRAANGAGVVWLEIDHRAVSRVPVGDVESVIAHLRGVREAAVAVVLKEYEPCRWSVSLRSRDGIDVSRIAAALGGGGHPAAAGCTVNGTGEQVAGIIRDHLH